MVYKITKKISSIQKIFCNDIEVGTKYRWNTRKMSESARFAHMFDKSIGLVRKWSEVRVGLVAA